MDTRSFLILAGALLAPSVALADDEPDPTPPIAVMENFESGDIYLGALAPCRRPENRFSDQGQVYRMGRMAGSMTVFPPPLTRSLELVPPSKECIDPGQPYTPDGTERAELWERQKDRLPFGTDVWYGFSMYIGGEISTTDGNRLVIGQWKEAGGGSPIMAQRFKNRTFFITVEQDAPTPGDSCRILVAYQSEPPPMADSSDGNDQPCMKDIVVERFDYLPNPFDSWTDMVYHFRPSPEGYGIAEVWAGGKLIARASGRIGYANPPLPIQYFKFGPYRNPATYATTAYLDAFRRGSSYEEVTMGGKHQVVPLEISRNEDGTGKTPADKPVIPAAVPAPAPAAPETAKP